MNLKKQEQRAIAVAAVFGVLVLGLLVAAAFFAWWIPVVTLSCVVGGVAIAWWIDRGTRPDLASTVGRP